MLVRKRSPAVRAVTLDAPEAMREQWYAPYVVTIDGSLRLLSEHYQPAVDSYDPRHPQTKLTMTSAFTLDTHRVHRGATISSAAMPWMIEGHCVRETPGPGQYELLSLMQQSSFHRGLSSSFRSPLERSSIRNSTEEVKRIRESTRAERSESVEQCRKARLSRKQKCISREQKRRESRMLVIHKQRQQSKAIASARNQMTSTRAHFAMIMRNESLERLRVHYYWLYNSGSSWTETTEQGWARMAEQNGFHS